MENDSTFWKDEPTGDKITKKKREPIKLPEGFTIKNLEKENFNEVIQFIKNNYKDKIDSSLSLEYSDEFIKWYLVNHCKKEYCLVLFYLNELVGFISGSEVNLCVNKEIRLFLGVNFLCLHLNFRNKKLAPLLISQLTFIANENNIFHAIFTGGKSFPFSFVKVNYFHRPINPKKLIESKYLFYYDEPELKSELKLSIPTKEDISQILKLYHQNNKNMKIYEYLSLEKAEKIFLPVNNSVITYVLKKDGKVEEYISYFLISTFLNYSNQSIKAAYLHSWYSNNIRLLLNESFLLLKEENVDVVNCLGFGKNLRFVKNDDFLEGTGMLNYYFYNFKTENIEIKEISYVMY
ncbi:N-myristoyl transferase [Tubulinosema ratisbonensis]|uniref:Glycylpeptide N-tetradecanoyltransferase n=1 Tax=Tubulinosema ratisbonensis TaxID=291195 RepID=A0A437AKS0_9MICR|nr:N-myristoyl transferase [Tubulinosema ratisbonensis]